MAKMLFDEKFVHDLAMKALEYEVEGKTIREWIDILKDYQSSKWISVEERLPEAGVFVLLQYAKNAQNPTLHARNTMAVGRYEYGMFLVEGCSVRVTHWMPLPEPPKEGT